MNETQIEKIARDFLSSYEAKDLRTIATFLADSVVVRDWNHEVNGKDKALLEFGKNFQQAQSLSIKVLQLLSSDRSVAAEVDIKVNGVDSLRVVDVFTFDANQQITSIVSYKGL